MHRRAIVAVFGLLAACGGRQSPEGSDPDAPPESFVYTVAVAPNLEELDITVCFEGAAPEALFAGQRAAASACHTVEDRTPGRPPRRLERQGNRIPLDAIPTGGCVGYMIDLESAISSNFLAGLAMGRTIVANASIWLWRPAGLGDRSGEVRFELASGLDVAVPWAREGQGYRLDARTFGFLSHVVFGEFERVPVQTPGDEQIEVILVPGSTVLGPDGLRRWIENASAQVTHLTGRFPADGAMVVVVPIDRGDDPVAFGNVGRGGGASVMLLANKDATYDELIAHWVPVHEFSHLAMPYVQREDAWLSEGIATYYQEILRARAGVISPLDAWRNIDRGFASGRRAGTGRSLREESRAVYQTFAFRRVYWGGTAIALLADIELRRGDYQARSLDDLVAAIGDCCNETTRPWPADRVLGHFAETAGAPVVSEVAEPLLASSEFPDVDAALGYLGLVRGESGRLEFDDTAPGAELRQAITAPHPALADAPSLAEVDETGQREASP
ncbi:MAG: hypothetical protein AAGF12_11190 [Myxococcota bacterium]